MAGERNADAAAPCDREEDARTAPAPVDGAGDLCEEDGSASAVIVKSVPPASPSLVPTPANTGVIQGSRRWLFIAKHYAWTSLRSLRWWFLVALTLVQVGAIASPLIRLKVGWHEFVVSFGVLLLTQALKNWKENQPKHRHIVDRNYDERKLALYKLIHAIQDRHLMLPPQIAEFQRDALALIASYVRDHRRDWKEPTIFANLLQEEGDHFVVIARDQEHRHGRARYPKRGMLAAKALDQGSPVLTGDVYRDYPDTPPGKGYCSVLAIPLHRDGEVVGVISIDSSQKFHFDIDGPKLVDYLRPYIALLAWTLPKRAKGLYLPLGVTR